MINKIVVYEALKHMLSPESNVSLVHKNKLEDQDSLISLLVHDIFGGEILKTHTKKNWHFYNRIDGERIDFTISKIQRYLGEESFEDIPSTPAETYDYVDKTDYSTFFMTFIRACEEVVGLEKHKYNLAY